jgi:hypothetical protein
VTRGSGEPRDGHRAEQKERGEDECQRHGHYTGGNSPEFLGGVKAIGRAIPKVVDYVEATRREREGHEGTESVAKSFGDRNLPSGDRGDYDEAVLNPLTWPEGADDASQEIARLRHR